MISRIAFTHTLAGWLAITVAGLTHSTGLAPTQLEIKHDRPVAALAWSHDGKRLASAGDDGVIRLTDISTGKETARFTSGASVTGLVFSANGKLLGFKSGAADGPLCVWEVDTQKKPKQLSFKGYSCNHLAFTPDGQTLVASGPGEHMVWNHGKGGGYGSKGANIPADSAAAVSPDGAIVAWCNAKGLVQLFFPEQRKSQRMQIGPAQAMAFSPDGRFLAASSSDKTIRLWAVLSGEVRKFEGLRAPAMLLSFSGNGKVLAAASPGDPVVRIWDAGSARLRRRLTTKVEGEAGVRALALSPDGRSLAVAIGNFVNVWNVATRDLGQLGEAKALAEPAMKASWEDLTSGEPEKSEAAFRRLAQAQHHALDFLREQVRAVAVPHVDRKRVTQLLEELDHQTYAVRQRASSELAKFGEVIKTDLERYAAKPSLETNRRASKLLERLPNLELQPERLRCLDAIEILEILNTPQARDILRELGRESLIAQIRLAARDALERMGRLNGIELIAPPTPGELP